MCVLKFFTSVCHRPAIFFIGTDIPFCNLIPQSGNTFFSGWNFFTGADPTNGNVEYVDQATAVRVLPAFLTSACVS